MRILAISLLLLSGCATNQYVYDCVDWYKHQDPVKEWHHNLVTARSLDDAVQFFRTQKDDQFTSFYCGRYYRTTKDGNE